MMKFRFEKEDFRTALCVGELKTALDRVTTTANEILESHLNETELDEQAEWERLRLASIKLGSLACLIERQREDESISDTEDIYGLGLLLAGIGQDVRQVSRRLELHSMKTDD